MQDDRRVVVIGSGPAGSAAAAFLLQAGVEVTLLEAGSARDAFGLTAQVGGMTVAKIRRDLHERPGLTMAADPTAKAFEELSPGGLTNHWSCAVPRFSRDDFRDAERAGEVHTWPIGYHDLAPWYSRVEPLLHVAGPRDDRPDLPAGNVTRVWELSSSWSGVVRAAAEAGRSVVPLPYVYGSGTTLTLSGTVFNAYVRILKPARRSGRLRIRYRARVLRLEWSPAARKVDAVVFRDALTGAEERVPCRAVILAAGTINTTQILLQSQSADFPHGLGNSHGVLGRYLHDHPLGKLVIDLGTKVAVHPPAYLTRAPLSQARPLYAAGCAQWTGVKLVAQSVLRGHPGKLAWIGFNVFGTMAPAEENRIELDPHGAGDSGSKALSLYIRHPPESLQLLEEARDQLVALLSRAGLEPRVRIWHVEAPGVSHHYAGACRMHASPRFGMLDAWSRLHEVRNVMVADSAAFTTGPEKNPVLTAMTLAARGADRLAQELLQGSL